MAVSVLVPTALRNFTEGNSSISVTASTVQEAIDQIIEIYPSLKKNLINDEGKLRNFVNLYIGENDIRHLEGVNTPIADGESLLIVPSIAGGSHGK